MYHILPGAALGGSVLGAKFVAPAMLPVTGIAFGLYVAAALGLLVTGVVMRVVGSRRDSA